MKLFAYRYKDIAGAGIAATTKQRDIIYDDLRLGVQTAAFLNPFIEDAIIPEVTYSTHNASYREKTVKAWTFYCDSVADELQDHKKGNGSKENPWRSLDYAIKKIAEYRNCMTGPYWSQNSGWLCCPEKFYFQIKVKGEINYRIGMESSQDAYENKFPYIIITSWGKQKVEISSPTISRISGLFFEKCKFIGTEFIGGSSSMLFYDCDFEYSTGDYYSGYFKNFHEIKIIKCNIKNSGNNTGALFYNTSSIQQDIRQLIDCYCENIIPGYSSVISVYNSEFSVDKWWTRDYYAPVCSHSELYNVDFYFTNDTIEYNVDRVFTIYNAFDCIFFNVNLYIDATLMDGKECEVIGFSGCGRSIFQNCSVSITPPQLECWYLGNELRGYIDAAGFSGNQDAVYSNCSTTNICQKCADETHVCYTPDF